MVRFISILVAAVMIASSANADDRLANEISVAQTEPGRMVVIATPVPAGISDGLLQRMYAIKQDDPRTDWNEWSPALAQLPTRWPATRIHAFLSKFGQLLACWLEGGVLRIARDAGNNAFFQSLAQQGANLNSLALTEDANNRVEAFAVAQDGTLWGVRQRLTGAWDAIKQIGGHDLAGGGAPAAGPLSTFVVHTNALAAALGVGGLVNAFAIGGDETLYVVKQTDPNQLPSVWSSLGGNGFVDVAAFSSQGRATVVAIDSGNILHSRREHIDGGWGSWSQAFAQPVDSWTAVPDNFGNAFLFVAIGNQIQVLTLNADGSWANNPLFQPFGFTGSPIAPFRQLSVAVGTGNSVMLTAVDSAGVIYSRLLDDMAPNAGSIRLDSASPTRIGEITISPNAPDVAAEALGCFLTQDEVSSLQTGVTDALNGSGALAAIGSTVNAELACTPSGNAQTVGLWLGRQPSPSTVPIDLLDLSPGANPLESAAIRLTQSGIERFFDATWAAFPKRLPAGHGYDIVLKSASLHYGKSDISIDIKGDFGFGKIPFPISLTVKAALDISSDGRPTCVASLSGSSQVLQLGSNAFIPLAGYLGFSNVIAGAASEYQDQAGVVCDLVQAIPSEIFLPPVQGQSLKKMVFTYNHLKVDETRGITYLMEIPPFPVDRQPRVAWYRVTGFVAGNTANDLLLEFVASSADMNQPAYTWSISTPAAKVIPLEGSRIAEVSLAFTHPLTVGQPLGTLTVSVTDADHGGTTAAVYSAPLLVTSDMLHVEAPKDPNHIPHPLMPR